jgi:hypothetical protein
VGFGGTGMDRGYGIAVDPQNRIHTTGSFFGTADFDPGPGTLNLTSAGDEEVFVSRLNSTGALAAALRFGAAFRDWGGDVVVDSAGNSYITGRFRDTVDFDPGAGNANLSSNGSDDVFVLKLDANANYVWAAKMGGSSSDFSWGIAVDGQENVYVTGYFQGTADFDPGPGTVELASNGGNDIFVIKLNPDGNLLWAHSFGSTQDDYGRAVAVHGNGSVYATANFAGTADFDPGAGIASLTSSGLTDVVVLKLNAAGEYIWARRFGGTEHDRPRTIALDDAGNIYTAGNFNGAADFDPGPGVVNLNHAGAADIFISKLNADGEYVWARSFGSGSNDEGYGVAVDSANRVYLTGYFHDVVDFDPGPGVANLSSVGNEDIFVAQLDDNGQFIWAEQAGGPGADGGHAITVAGDGKVFATGHFQNSATFGGTNVTSTGDSDVYVLMVE